MDSNDQVRAVKELLFNHVCTPYQRHIRDGWAIHLLANEIVEKLRQRDGVWRKWTEQRETLVKSATDCWIPIEDLQEYLNGMPGPQLTRMDVAQRLRAFQEDEYGSRPNEGVKSGCRLIFEKEKAEGTELPAIIGAIQEWVEQEEIRQMRESQAERQRQIEAEKLALEQRLLSGADCKWTPLNKSAEVYCRTNGRTYRLSRTSEKSMSLHRIKTLEDTEGLLIGNYRTRGDATKVISEAAYQPEPRW